MVLHVCFQSLYISLPSSEKQQREIKMSYVFWRTCTAMANFRVLPLELNVVIAYLAWGEQKLGKSKEGSSEKGEGWGEKEFLCSPAPLPLLFIFRIRSQFRSLRVLFPKRKLRRLFFS